MRFALAFLGGINALLAAASPGGSLLDEHAFLERLRKAAAAREGAQLMALAAKDARTSLGRDGRGIDTWLREQPLAFERIEKALAFGCQTVVPGEEPDGIGELKSCPPDLLDPTSSISGLLQVVLLHTRATPADGSMRAPKVVGVFELDVQTLAKRSAHEQAAIETLSGDIPVLTASGEHRTLPADRSIWLAGTRLGLMRREDGWRIVSLVSGD